jgi:hypothetical protein
MKTWKELSRKLDGWVERRRRYAKTGVEPLVPAVQKDPVLLETPAPTKAPDRKS